MAKKKFFKRSWISAAVLKPPEVKGGNVHRGAIILNQVDPLVELYPDLKKLFFIIERHGWYGPNEATRADIMLVEDLTAWEQLERECPDSILLDIGPADFIDAEAFLPLAHEIRFDVIQVSCWSPRKRIELFIEAAARLQHLSFVHLGHFENNGSAEELAYRDECLGWAKSVAKNIYFPFANCNHNYDFPNTKAEVNRWINQARLGVLTTMSEGINRFKMECFAANRPCLVADDVASTTRKHINEMTGSLFSANVDALVETITATLSRLGKFAPRDYVILHTGKTNSLPKLKNALKRLCIKNNEDYRFGDIDWDGRNESLLWGDDAVRLLDTLMQRYRRYLDLAVATR